MGRISFLSRCRARAYSLVSSPPTVVDVTNDDGGATNSILATATTSVATATAALQLDFSISSSPSLLSPSRSLLTLLVLLPRLPLLTFLIQLIQLTLLSVLALLSHWVLLTASILLNLVTLLVLPTVPVLLTLPPLLSSSSPPPSPDQCHPSLQLLSFLVIQPHRQRHRRCRHCCRCHRFVPALQLPALFARFFLVLLALSPKHQELQLGISPGPVRGLLKRRHG